jgi:ABC-2 type transport system permease protein
VPLLTPILFALVIAPALKQALHTSAAYEAFVATGTIGLLIPLNTMFAGISVLVDRESGAQRELLAAPIPRALLVVANLIVAFAITALQIAVLLVVARARGIHFDVTRTGLLWFLAAGSIFTIGMYGAAETLAARVPRTEEYIGRVPAIAIVPWFLAGSRFPINALPSFLTWFARLLPLTHTLALVRYGLLNDPSSLDNIWRMHDTTTMAALSLLVVAAFAVLPTIAGIRVFSRTAVS